jgi:UDP-N-acetylmuramoylalanine--D-glutamate ligase
MSAQLKTHKTPLDLISARVVVMGLGRFGGGVGVTRFLVGQGADVLVTDLASPDQLRQSIAALDGLGVRFRLGEHCQQDFADADLIVVNPAVKPSNPYVLAAREANTPCTSEIRLLIGQLPNRLTTIGITGSAGKSTVTAMVGHLLTQTLGADRVHVGGNLGGSILDHLDQIEEDHWVVLELSSFMLEGLIEDAWSPHIAVVTNLTPNHLDWHGSFENYLRAKAGILDHQRKEEGDIRIFGPDVASKFSSDYQDASIIDVSMADRIPDTLLIPGWHNRLNAAMAFETLASVRSCIAGAGVSRGTGVEAAGNRPNHEQDMPMLGDFGGLPHRLQWVDQRQGVRYFNDSKATTPEAAMLAMQSFDAKTVHVILGGYDKGSDLTEMAHDAAQNCYAIYTVGATGDRIADLARNAADVQAKIFCCVTLDQALAKAAKAVRPGDVVLLSPGCASWDQYDNFEVRGEAFVEAVKLLP